MQHPHLNADERLERLMAMQAVMARVSRELGPAIDLDATLATVLHAMRGLVTFRGGSIGLVDDRGVYLAAADPPILRDVSALRVPVGKGLAGRIVAECRPVYSPDLDTDRRVDQALRKAGADVPARSYLGVPLVVLGTVIGVLQVDSNEVDAFDLDDQIVLEGLATQVAGAVESARRYEQVVELQRLKSDFIARVSHELRTPITIMAGFTQTLLGHGDRLAEQERVEMLERIERATGRLSTLIDQMVHVATYEAGLAGAQPEDVVLAPLLRVIRDGSISPDAVKIDCPSDATLRLDPGMLRDALAVLVDNALKYAGDATVTVEDRAIHVRDHGPGVAPEMRERVFERFVRGDHTTYGMGLGLPLARALAADMGARLEVSDADGGGAYFTLRFP